MTLAQLAEELQGQLDGNGSVTVRGVASLSAAGGDQVSFLTNSRYAKQMSASSAAGVIVPKDYSGPRAPGSALIRCDDAYFAFRQAMVLFYGFRKHDFEGIDPRSAVDPSANIAHYLKIGRKRPAGEP